MRKARLKFPEDRAVGYYHCVSRVVHRQMLLGTAEKEKFVQIMREYEEFCEVKVLTFCVMTNHFHILIEIPKRPEKPPSAEALLKKLTGGLDFIGKAKVEQFITTDGFKFLLPNREWVAFRASGTEPLIRCYIEARSAKQMKTLEQACRAILAG